MFSQLKRLLSRKAPPQQLATAEDATNFLAELFRAHGLPVVVKEGRIISDTCGFKAQARLFNQREVRSQTMLQLDVEVCAPANKNILESVAGWGANLHEAIRTALYSFSQGSFHVIFSALTGRPCSHCEMETWQIGGIARRVFLGPTTTRQSDQDEASPSTEWFPALEAQIKALNPSSGMHWFRFYHAETPSGPVTEALLDNEPSPLLERALAAHAWRKTSGFYSTRLFMIVIDEPGGPRSK